MRNVMEELVFVLPGGFFLSFFVKFQLLAMSDLLNNKSFMKTFDDVHMSVSPNGNSFRHCTDCNRMADLVLRNMVPQL